MIDVSNFNAYDDRVRTVTQELDFWRMLFIRSRRMLLLSVRLFEQFEVYTIWIKYLDGFLRNLALYQAIILIPRFVINVSYVYQHLQEPVSHMMIARCWEMAYDFGWIMSGFLAAFILVGSLAPLASYLSLITSCYQLVMHTTRFLMDYHYGKTFEKNYVDLMRIVMRMGVSMCAVSTGIVILVWSANPMIPFLAAALVVAATVANKILTKKLVSGAVPDESPVTSSYVHQSIYASKHDIHTTEQNETNSSLVLHEKSC